MQFIINGRSQHVDCDVRTSLLDLLRDHMGLTGTKKGCDQGPVAPAPYSLTVSASIRAWRWPCSTKRAPLLPSRGSGRPAICHLDVPSIEIIWNDIPDPQSPLGLHGIGEIGITGAAAAIANAVYNATGKRIRELPITLDKILATPAGRGS